MSDEKAAALDAFARSAAQMSRVLGAMTDGRRAVPGMTWSVADLAAHLVLTLQQLTTALEGGPCAYDGTTEAGTTAAVDERLLAAFPDRDLRSLATAFATGADRFAAVVASLDGDHPVPAIAPNATAAAICAIFVLDHHNHGMQLSRAGGPAWRLDLPDIRACLATVAAAAYDQSVAASTRVRLTLRLRGTEPLGIEVDHGPLVVGPLSGRADCRIVADPASFLLLTGGGFASRPRLLLTGKLLAYGRRPWAALELTRLLPPASHGGKAHQSPRDVVVDLRDARRERQRQRGSR